MAGDRVINFEGRVIHVPSDFTDAEVQKVLGSYSPPITSNAGLAGPAQPKLPGLTTDSFRNDGSIRPALPGPMDRVHDLVDAVTSHSTSNAEQSGQSFQRGQYAKGTHQAISAAAPAALPLLPEAALAAPVATALGTASGYLGGKISRPISKSLGATPDQQDLIEDLTGIASGTAAAQGSGSLVRGAGRALSSVESVPDIPTGWGSRTANLGARVFNAVKNPLTSAVGAAGKYMRNFGIPEAPNVYPGEVPKDFHNPVAHGDPELPIPVRPDAQPHYNDVQDPASVQIGPRPPSQRPDPLWKSAGTTTTVPETQTVTSGRDAFSRRNATGLSDAMDAQSRGSGWKPPTELAPSPIRTMNDRPSIMRKSPLTPSNAEIPDPDPAQLEHLRGFIRGGGESSLPQNGLDTDEPWDKILDRDELGHALDTDPYNQTLDELQPFRRRKGDLKPK